VKQDQRLWQHLPEPDLLRGIVPASAVRSFQQAVHADVPSMAVDGIVGPMTWRALIGGMYSF
jgi:peptidoglycan hydrolase-like protein with peptidoglycan-binding domain